jgi:hypothetical protein
MSPFEIKDCALLTRMSGLPPAVNLRELRERIAACSPDVLYHHFCDTLLAPSIDYPCETTKILQVWLWPPLLLYVFRVLGRPRKR